MNKIDKVKNLLATVVQSRATAADGWHFLRTAVHELHGLLKTLDQALLDFESRLAQLEAQAGGGTSKATSKARAKIRRSTSAAARKKTATRKR